MKITDINVMINTKGADEVFIKTGLPSPTPGLTLQHLSLHFSVEAGQGVAYIVKHFHVAPLVFDAKTGQEWRHEESA